MIRALLVPLLIVALAGVAQAKPTSDPEPEEKSSAPRRGGGGGGGGSVRHGELGVGLILGDPTAVGLRLWLDRELALQVWLGGAPTYGGLQTSVDLIINAGAMVNATHLQLDFWFGFGGALGFWERGDLYVAARVPLGLSFWIKKVRGLEPFVEIAPSLRFGPKFGFGFDGGIGARYFF